MALQSSSYGGVRGGVGRRGPTEGNAFRRGNEHGKKTGRAKRLTRAARKEGGERGEEENIALRTGKKKAR